MEELTNFLLKMEVRVEVWGEVFRVEIGLKKSDCLGGDFRGHVYALS